MSAGMASEGIVTVLTQYLQLKLGYVTSDQARFCPAFSTSVDAVYTLLQPGTAGSCQR